MVHTVIIINNEKIQRDILNNFIQNCLGYRTLTTATIQEAAYYFQPNQSYCPDLILLDWPMGNKEDIERLRNISIHAPIVAMIKFGDYDSALEALNAGAQDFLPKPVAMERISTTFRNLLLLRDALGEVERLRQERFVHNEAPVLGSKAKSVGPMPFTLIGEDGNIRRMQEIEAESIRFAMQYYHGRMTEVARRLGIGRSTLYRKLSELSIRQKEAA